MKLSEFKKNNIPFHPILFLEQIYSHRVRRMVLLFSKYILYLFLIGFFVSRLYHHHIPVLVNLLGLTFIFLTFSVITLLLESFFRSYYYSGFTKSELGAGRVIYQAKGGDLVGAFFSLPIGQKIGLRLGISRDMFKQFLSSRTEPVIDYNLPDFGSDHFFTTKDLTIALFKQDKDFSKLLFNSGIGEKDLVSALDWIIMEEEYFADKERWWSRENLSETKAIGKDFAFGRTPFLDKFSRDLSVNNWLFGGSAERSYRDDIVSQIEIVFSKSKNANVILVGDPGIGPFKVVLDFVRKIVSGRVSSAMAYGRVIELDWNLLVSESKEKAIFESNLIRGLNEALLAGNVILVIQDFPAFITSAESLGSAITSLLAPYLEKDIQLIATSDPISFHQKIESNPTLVQYFQRVLMEEPNDVRTLEIVENFLREIEQKLGIIFTYQAVAEIIRSANYYITMGVMPAKAINLILEIAANATHTGIRLIGKKEVLDFIRLKTNIPVGEIQAREKEVLLNMEENLHKRVVGQAEAITAISNALRRGRAGVRDPKKPIGSFLFLGPTGVGKTETAKALAQIFYGNEKFMLRLDMSEYQTPDSMNRLIGSFQDNKTGVLSNMLRENPYGVLLLDEFEKADRDVLNLFLQILDEGFFSDMAGKKVSTQNIIFIATSNAASDMIFSITERGDDPSKFKTEIIQKIVSDGVYKPELINRFDDTIIFHPLTKDELEKISGLMLNKLASRLREKGIELVINPLMIQKVMDAGYNRMFGARPMNRAIQEKVEEPIAKKIISGELASGSKMEFKEEDFAPQT